MERTEKPTAVIYTDSFQFLQSLDLSFPIHNPNNQPLPFFHNFSIYCSLHFKKNVVEGFCTQIKKCNKVVKRYDIFTKLTLLTIGVPPTIINAK